MPSAGRRISSGTLTLAVGKPHVRPRWSPRATVPRTSYGRPSIALAVARSPATRAARVAAARLLEELELLVEIGEQAGRRLGAHHAGRMAVEGDHRGGEAALPRQPAHVGDHGPMAEVHAVVGADCDRGALWWMRALGEV